MGGGINMVFLGVFGCFYFLWGIHRFLFFWCFVMFLVFFCGGYFLWW